MAAVEIRVSQNRLPRHFIKRDVLRRELGRRSDHRRMAHVLRILQRPRQRLHPAQTATDHRGKTLNPELVGKPGLSRDPVFNGDKGKLRPPRLAGKRIHRARPGRTVAAAKVIDPDDKKLVGIQRLARPHEVVPPAASLVLIGIAPSNVVRTGERMANQHGIIACGVELAIGLIDQLVTLKLPAALERQRLIKTRPLRRDNPDG